MGLLDKLKDLFSGRSRQVKGGIDKASDFIGDKVGPKHADKVENVAEKAKGAVDKLDSKPDDAAAGTSAAANSAPDVAAATAPPAPDIPGDVPPAPAPGDVPSAPESDRPAP